MSKNTKKRPMLAAINMEAATVTVMRFPGVNGDAVLMRLRPCRDCGKPGVLYVHAICPMCHEPIDHSVCASSCVVEADGRVLVDADVFVCDDHSEVLRVILAQHSVDRTLN